jgi:hypothetical protein
MLPSDSLMSAVWPAQEAPQGDSRPRCALCGDLLQRLLASVSDTNNIHTRERYVGSSSKQLNKFNSSSSFLNAAVLAIAAAARHARYLGGSRESKVQLHQ